MLQSILLIAGAYLLGSIPTGLLLARAAGVDIRTTGSGNIGATNVYRTLGRTVGILTLVGDCLKGLIPVLIAQRLGMGDTMIAAAGAAAFLGHVYTVFLGFKGGKGSPPPSASSSGSRRPASVSPWSSSSPWSPPGAISPSAPSPPPPPCRSSSPSWTAALPSSP